jgi:nucleotide-binding universal stress UspA family protein
MSPIVCATRGGEASRRTQEHAIRLAKERGDELIFLCVFDPSFAGPLSAALAAAVADEQRWLGRALLGIAQSRARGQKVEAQAEVRNGPVMESIEEYLRQVQADTLVIGASKEDTALAAFDLNEVERFAKKIQEDTGVEVVVVPPERGGEL